MTADWESNYELRLSHAEAIGRQGMQGGHGEHLDPDRGTKNSDELDQIHGQRRESAATKQAERLRDEEIARIKSGEVIDPDGKTWTQEEMRDEKPHHERKMQIAEQFANERRALQGLATRDTSLTEVKKGKFDDRMTWRNGRLVEKSRVENAAFAESARQQRAFIDAENRMRAFKAGPDSFEEAGYAPPEKGAPDYSTPKAATGFATTSINRRVKKADISPKARTLLTIETAIRVAQSKGDKAGVGRLLLEAKESTLDHGEFMKWAERATGLTSRSCRNYMARQTKTENKK